MSVFWRLAHIPATISWASFSSWKDFHWLHCIAIIELIFELCPFLILLYFRSFGQTLYCYLQELDMYFAALWVSFRPHWFFHWAHLLSFEVLLFLAKLWWHNMPESVQLLHPSCYLNNISITCFLNHWFIFDTQIFYFIFSFGQFNSNSMSLVLNCFLLCQQHISMDINFLFSLLHAHFELILFILKAIDVIGGAVETFLDFFNF